MSKMEFPKPEKIDESKMIPVVIATAERAVIGGLMEGGEYARLTRNGQWKQGVTIHQGRMAVRWTSTEQSAMGLAEFGPGPGCRITKARSFADPHIPVWIGRMTESAWKKWKDEPWA